MAYALGLGDALVGVSHECDFPPEARSKPAVSHPAFALEGKSLAEIDRTIAEHVQRGESLYRVDESLLRALKPDLIVTQDLCHVCAPSGNELATALRALDVQPEVLFMSPNTIDGIERNILDFGAVTDREREALAVVERGRERIAATAARVRGARRPRVFVAEWVAPLFCAGHWIPEMVTLAGGVDLLGRAGEDSVRIDWDEVRDASPDVIVVAPCGFHLTQALEQARSLTAMQGFWALPAARAGRVYGVDADAYFVRPGPRVVDGIEVLASLFHPELLAPVPWAAQGLQLVRA